VSVTVAVIGSRYGLVWAKVSDAIRSIVSRPDVGILVSGGAIGVDRIGESLAIAAGKRTHVIRPDWKRYGKSAGMRRNADIIAMADEVHAFWDGESPGTDGAINIAKRMKKKLTVYDGNGIPRGTPNRERGR
jgi:hypothetical protein